jgi:hypothetical protein
MLKSLLLPATTNLILQIVLETTEHKLQQFILLTILPVAQILAQPSISPQSGHKGLQNTANHLKQATQRAASCNLNSEDSKFNTSVGMGLLLHYQPYSLFNSMADTFTTIISSCTAMKTWLNEISDESHLSKMQTSSLESLALMLSAMFLRALSVAGDDKDLSLIVKALCMLTKAQPDISPSLLPLFLDFLPLVSSQSFKLALLYSLPSLATHQLAVGPTANVLRVLGGNSSLLPVSLCLLGKLWIDHDFIYPHLISVLEQRSVAIGSASEFEIAKATVIKDICSIRGEQHGEQMLSHISVIIEQSKHPLAIALATDALADLCKCDIVDPVSVWSILGELLSQDPRIPVAVASCSLLSLAANVDSELRSAAKKFKSAALKHLWKMVFSKNHEVCSAALNALSLFKADDFLVEHLPPEAPLPQNIPTLVVDPLAENPEETKTQLPIPTGYFICLVTIIPQGSLTSLSSFLSGLLQSELDTIPRGVVSAAQQQSQGHSSLEKAVRGVENMLQGMCLANRDKDSAYGLVSGTTLMLHGIISLTLPSGFQERGGQVAVREMKEYSTHLDEALQKGRVCLKVGDSANAEGIESAMSCLVQPRLWAAFMKKVCDSFTKSWLVRKCPISIWEDPAALEPKVFEARDWAKQELVKKLAELSKSSPDLSPSILLCLVGLVCAVELSTCNSGVESSEPSSAWTHVQLLQLTITEVQNVLTRITSEYSGDHPVPLLLSTLRQHAADSVFLLTVPVLVEAALCYTAVPSLDLYSHLKSLACSVWSFFNKHPVWYGGIVLNEILVMLLPRLSQVEAIMSSLNDFAGAAVESQSFEQLSLTSSLLPSLCIAKQTNTVLGVLKSITTALQSASSEELGLQHGQISALHIANSCPLLYLAGILSHEDAMLYVSLLAHLATEAPQVPAYHLCLGTILHGLLVASHPTIQQLADTIAVRWIQQLSSTTSTNEVLPLVWGLAGLLSANPVPKPWYNDGVFPMEFLETLFPVLRDVYAKISDQVCPSISINITWLLGNIYYNLIFSFNNMERVATSYNYLSENTLLPTLMSDISVDVLQRDLRQVKCLLTVLSSVKRTFPPCDFSTILLPLVKRELLMPCIQVLVNHSSKMIGLKLFTRHIFNMLLMGSLQVDVQLCLLESLPCLLSLVPAWKYFHPLCVSVMLLYPKSQDTLHSLMKGLKGMLSMDKGVPCRICEVETASIIKQIWEHVCKVGTLHEILHSKENLILKMFADCLWMIKYTPVPFDLSMSTKRAALECVLRCYWAESGNDTVPNLSFPFKWMLLNEDTKVSRTVLEKLVQIIRVVCFDSKFTYKNSLLVQTELLHTLLLWTRENKATVAQMRLTIYLCLVITSPTPPGFTEILAIELKPWLASFTLPNGPVVQEKVLQCVLEWFSYNDDEIHKICLSLLQCFTGTVQYNVPFVWTSAAHLL